MGIGSEVCVPHSHLWCYHLQVSTKNYEKTRSDIFSFSVTGSLYGKKVSVNHTDANVTDTVTENNVTTTTNWTGSIAGKINVTFNLRDFI